MMLIYNTKRIYEDTSYFILSQFIQKSNDINRYLWLSDNIRFEIISDTQNAYVTIIIMLIRQLYQNYFAKIFITEKVKTKYQFYPILHFGCCNSLPSWLRSWLFFLLLKCVPVIFFNRVHDIWLIVYRTIRAWACMSHSLFACGSTNAINITP